MKKNFFRILSVVAVAAMVASCNNQAPKMDEPVADSEEALEGLRIAYIELDTLTAQYEYAKQTSQELEKKGTNARNTIAAKSKQLETNVNNFQSKLQNNGFTSREQAENAQAALQREQNNLVALQQRLENELANEQAKFLQAFQDSLDSFLGDYNKDKKYDLILNKAAILHASTKWDITQDVVNGMNKRYKKSDPATDKKAAEKKADEKKADDKQ
ncbi:MAG: OmpH family outer membrane protein [Prevotella sp.]|nr:OmpH family outer membrane protein [Prevotella sp.]